DTQLTRSRIDADGQRSSARQPRGDVGGATPELRGPHAFELDGENPRGIFGNVEDAPARFVGGPSSPGGFQLFVVTGVPVRRVDLDVVEGLFRHYASLPEGSRSRVVIARANPQLSPTARATSAASVK